MNSAKERVRDTIQNMNDHDLYSIGDAQLASDHVREKAYTLQHNSEKEEKEQDNQDQ